MSLDFHSNNPGAVFFGNFINYYSFQSAEDRIECLPKGCWTPWLNSNMPPDDPLYLLDVGCNTGRVTMLLYEMFKTEFPTRGIHILGIDIDEVLIKRANECNKYPSHIEFKTLDVMQNEHMEELENIMAEYSIKRFNAVFCFSITMWIHLNHKDEGLQRFLTMFCNLSDIFVVEPQPWSCYTRAKARIKKADKHFPYFQDLKWRASIEQDIVDYIERKIGKRIAYSSQPTKWKRKIFVFIN